MKCYPFRLLIASLFLCALATTSHAEPPRKRIELPSEVLCVAWSPDGKQIVSGTRAGTIHIIDAASARITGSIPAIYSRSTARMPYKDDKGGKVDSVETRRAVTAIGMSPDGKNIAYTDAHQHSSVVDSALGNRVGLIRAHGNELRLHTFTSDGQGLLSVGPKSWSVVWDTHSGPAASRDFLERHDLPMSCAPDGTALAWCDAGGMLRRLVPLKEIDFEERTLQIGKADCIALGPLGKVVAVGRDKGLIELWNLETRTCIQTLDGLEHRAVQLLMAFNGKTVAALADGHREIVIWDLESASRPRRIRHNLGKVGSIALSPDGKTLASTAEGSNSISLWNTEALPMVAEPSLKLSPATLSELWQKLASENGDEGEEAWGKLRAGGDEAVTFLGQRLRSLAMPLSDLEALAISISKLDSSKYAEREAAGKELVLAGEVAILPLKRLLERPPSLEAATRARAVLKRIGEPKFTPDRIRVLEAIDLLEQMASPRAVELLQELERDALIAQIQFEASDALKRIGGAKEKNSR